MVGARGAVVATTVVTVVAGTGSLSEPALLRTTSTSVTAPVMIAAMPNQNMRVPNPKRRGGADPADCADRPDRADAVTGISSVIIAGGGALLVADD